jgi:predicted nucleic acid-binding Zn ribbon protein
LKECLHCGKEYHSKGEDFCSEECVKEVTW